MQRAPNSAICALSVQLLGYDSSIWVELRDGTKCAIDLGDSSNIGVDEIDAGEEPRLQCCDQILCGGIQQRGKRLVLD